MAKYCSECGKSIQSSWNLCPNCGLDLKSGQTSESVSNLSKKTKESVILFKSKGFYCEEKPHGFTLAGNMKKGYIVLSSEALVFSPKRGKSKAILIPEIENVEGFSRRGYNMLGIQTIYGNLFTYWSANMVLGNYYGGKTSELQALLTQVISNKR